MAEDFYESSDNPYQLSAFAFDRGVMEIGSSDGGTYIPVLLTKEEVERLISFLQEQIKTQ